MSKQEPMESDIIHIDIKRSDLRMLLITLGMIASGTPLPAELERVRNSFKAAMNRETE